jgi:hypothetical protein
MAYPQESAVETDHSVWYSYSLQFNGVAIGSFERFSARSTRNVERIREILFSRGAEVVEMVPGGTDHSVDLSYVELYQDSLIEVIGGPIFTIEDMTFPITIVEVMKLPDSIGGKRILEYVDSWATDWGKELDTGGAKVVESMTFQTRVVVGRRTS